MNIHVGKNHIEPPQGITEQGKKMFIIKRFESLLNESLSNVKPAMAVEMFNKIDLPIYRIESYAGQKLLGTMMRLHDPKTFTKMYMEWLKNNGL